MGSHVPVIEQSDYHFRAGVYLITAIINTVNGSKLDDLNWQTLNSSSASRWVFKTFLIHPKEGLTLKNEKRFSDA